MTVTSMDLKGYFDHGARGEFLETPLLVLSNKGFFDFAQDDRA